MAYRKNIEIVESLANSSSVYTKWMKSFTFSENCNQRTIK